ncbi:MAG: hypothetical protein ABIV50_07370, partial [Opitutus sp.]
VVLRLGGFALPLSAEQAKTVDRNSNNTPELLAAVADDARGTVLQPLLGSTILEWDARLDESTPRQHVSAPFHVTPVMRTDRLNGSTLLAALSWTGSLAKDARPWRVQSARAETWKLSHDQLGDWKIMHWSLPQL